MCEMKNIAYWDMLIFLLSRLVCDMATSVLFVCEWLSVRHYTLDCITVLGMWGTRNELVWENIGNDQLENVRGVGE